MSVTSYFKKETLKPIQLDFNLIYFNISCALPKQALLLNALLMSYHISITTDGAFEFILF